MPSKTNRLLRLVEQFEALPKQTDLKQSKFQLRTIAERTDAHTEELGRHVGRLEALRDIQGQPELLKTELEQSLNALRAVAQTLEQQIRPGGQTAKITGALDTLSKVEGALSRNIAQAWTTADTEILEATRTLIELTGKYNPAAQRELQLALTRFDRTRGGGDPDAVATYREARDALVKVRTELKIPGAVGEFLSEAARGAGSASGLMDAEVQAFLNEHPNLWPRLRVTLT
jgi:hypothetical protein